MQVITIEEGEEWVFVWVLSASIESDGVYEFFRSGEAIVNKQLCRLHAFQTLRSVINRSTPIWSRFIDWSVTPGINTLLLSTGALGSYTCLGMILPIYMGPTALRGIRATGDKLSNVESQAFTPYKFGSSAGDRTPDLLITRPTCYHSATALWWKDDRWKRRHSFAKSF